MRQRLLRFRNKTWQHVFEEAGPFFYAAFRIVSRAGSYSRGTRFGSLWTQCTRTEVVLVVGDVAGANAGVRVKKFKWKSCPSAFQKNPSFNSTCRYCCCCCYCLVLVLVLVLLLLPVESTAFLSARIRELERGPS